MLAKNVINGTWGELWLDGDKVGELSAFQAKVTLNKVDVNICGDLWKRQKVVGMEGKGMIKIHKVSSRMIIKMKDNMKTGKQSVCTIVAKLTDPDSWGAERVVIKDCVFDELTLMDFEVKKNIEETYNFSFSDYDFMDLIEAQ